MSYEFITQEKKGRVGLVTLNRPKQLNALNAKLMQELGQALQAFDADPDVGAILVTGGERLFAAGDQDRADIRVRVEGLQGLAELLHQLGVQRVELLRPVQRDQPDAALLFLGDEFIAHRRGSPLRRSRSARRGTR